MNHEKLEAHRQVIIFQFVWIGAIFFANFRYFLCLRMFDGLARSYHVVFISRDID